MFCFQCEQTANGTGCTTGGVCGKSAQTAQAQDELTGAIIALAQSAHGKQPSEHLMRLVYEGLFTTVTNVSFDESEIKALTLKIKKEVVEHVKKCTHCVNKYGVDSVIYFDMRNIWTADEDIRSLKSLVLLGLRGIASYAYHALVLGYSSESIDLFMINALAALAEEKTQAELSALFFETGKINYECMSLLDKANTNTYGNPLPCTVPLEIEKGPFIVVSGHDLHDLYLLLEQTEGKGINIYTHGEMLPAHGYPKLKAFSHLKGNFGTAWQNQHKEFLNIPAPILFTSNCIMPVLKNYRDRVFTTGVVAFEGTIHVGGEKNFHAIIDKAVELGGYTQNKTCSGINGGKWVKTGYGRQTMISHLPEITDAIKTGKVSHIYLVGGCDGAKTGRNYYTDFVKNTPSNSLILTLACGKYRFNDLNLGKIGNLPRIMDMGQCNDSYGAIELVAALAKALNCGINDLPLSIVLSWYEQKAVAVLLSLLSLGVKNIYLGPSLPAFVSPAILKILSEEYGLQHITTAKEDMHKLAA